MGTPAVEVSNLTKRYSDGTEANRGISFTVEPGEFLGILGPNGAGKTTLVRQITTELMPSAGRVRVFGIDGPSRPNEVKHRMGIMPQEANLYSGLSVRHHLRIFGKLRGLPARTASGRAEELIADLGLEEHRDKPADQLSGGLRRRLLLGIALVANPSLADSRRTERGSRSRGSPPPLGPPAHRSPEGLHHSVDDPQHAGDRGAL